MQKAQAKEIIYGFCNSCMPCLAEAYNYMQLAHMHALVMYYTHIYIAYLS